MDISGKLIIFISLSAFYATPFNFASSIYHHYILKYKLLII